MTRNLWKCDECGVDITSAYCTGPLRLCQDCFYKPNLETKFKCVECGSEHKLIAECQIVRRRWSWRRFRFVNVIHRGYCRQCFERMGQFNR